MCGLLLLQDLLELVQIQLPVSFFQAAFGGVSWKPRASGGSEGLGLFWVLKVVGTRNERLKESLHPNTLRHM